MPQEATRFVTHQTKAKSILKWVVETWQNPLGWWFSVDHHVATGGYVIRARNGTTKAEIVIDANDAKAYRKVIRRIEELEQRATG